MLISSQQPDLLCLGENLSARELTFSTDDPYPVIEEGSILVS